MCIYQFLIAVRQDGNVLQNEDGETTRYSHFKTHMLATVNVIAGFIGWKCFIAFGYNVETEVCSLYQSPDGNVLPDNPDAGTWNQTSVCL